MNCSDCRSQDGGGRCERCWGTGAGRRASAADAGAATESHHNTHTHPFNGPFSGTTRVSRYQKGKANLDFTEARDSEWQWHQLGHMQVCTSPQTDNHASTPPLSFLQAACPSCRPTNSVKALKAKSHITNKAEKPTLSPVVRNTLDTTTHCHVLFKLRLTELHSKPQLLCRITSMLYTLYRLTTSMVTIRYDTIRYEMLF